MKIEIVSPHEMDLAVCKISEIPYDDPYEKA